MTTFNSRAFCHKRVPEQRVRFHLAKLIKVTSALSARIYTQFNFFNDNIHFGKYNSPLLITIHQNILLIQDFDSKKTIFQMIFIKI